MENNLENNFLVKQLYIRYPKNRIDNGINFILDNFKEKHFQLQKLFNLFIFTNIENKNYNLQDIQLLYYLSEFSIFMAKIYLDNPHFLDTYFLKEVDIYKLYGESVSYFIFIKLKILLFQKFKKYKDKFNLVENYLHDIEKLHRTVLVEDFFDKDISLERKKSIILEEYHKYFKEVLQKFFILLWIIENDIKNNILDTNINELENYKIIKEISNIFLKYTITKGDLDNIDILQNKYKVIENYKLFKDFLASL
jgi:hypothetical protein